MKKESMGKKTSFLGKSILVFFIIFALFLTACGGGAGSDTSPSNGGFVAVTSITGVPTSGTVGPLTLTGTVNPSYATNKAITWSVVSAGTTGANISGNTLTSTAAGTVTVRATIANGLAQGTAYIQNFDITITGDSNSSIITYTVTQTGGTDGVIDSTGIVFTFSASVDSLELTAADISISEAASIADETELEGSGTTRTLAITVNMAKLAIVSIAKTGIEATAKSVQVYKEGQAAPTLTNITAAYTGTTAIFLFTPLPVLKADLTVIARYSDDSEITLPAGDYTLGGTLSLGTSTITVTYQEKIDTFNVTVTDTVNTLAEWNAALVAIRNGGNNKNYIINIGGDISGITPITVSPTASTGFGTVTGVTITITGTGTLDTADSNGSMFYLGSGQTLVIDSENLTVRGRKNGVGGHTGDNNTVTIWVNSGAILELKNGTISGNTSSSSSSGGAGGVYNSGTFIMNGGEISGNAAQQGAGQGGGVWTSPSATFTMNSGKIFGNTAYSGGGVFASGTFTMNGGEISNNTAYWNGGGVSVANANFTMNGGEISGNTSSSYDGGGVHMSSGTFTMGGAAIISDNIAHRNGGGVYADNKGIFTMTGGELFGNTASSGGGVYLGYVIISGANIYNYGTFRIITGTVYGTNESDTRLHNTATTSGAALYVYSGATAQRGTLSGTVWSNRGSLSNTNNTIRVVDGEIEIVQGPPTLTGITLSTASVKKNYILSETLDLTGLVITANYSNNTSETVTGYTSIPAHGATLSSTGNNIIVTVNYTDGGVTRSNNFIIIVTAPGTPGLVYDLINGGTAYRVSKGTATSSAVVIPAAYNGLPVIEIGSASDSSSNGAFSNYTSLTTISIPASITSIGKYAFQNCTGLPEITIPASIASIGDYAFSGTSTNPMTLATVNFAVGSQLDGINYGTFQYCTSLNVISIPASVTSIGDYAFNGCWNLTAITIPASVTSIGRSAFNNCNNLGFTVAFAANSQLETIGAYAFSGCTGLTSITIPNRVTSIDLFAFSGCNGLTTIDIPASVTTIEYAFYDCNNLTNITINTDKVTTTFNNNWGTWFPADNLSVTFNANIGNNAFRFNNANNTKLANVTIAEGVTSIGECAFQYCTGLTAVIIPASVTSIGDYAFNNCNNPDFSVTIAVNSQLETIGNNAFSNCSGLNRSLTIPASVMSIGDYAFNNCNNIDFNVTFAANSQLEAIGNNAFSNCRGLMSIIIPASVTSIGDYAFNGCWNLTAITIPASVTSIGNSAFSSCQRLSSVTFAGSTISNFGSFAFPVGGSGSGSDDLKNVYLAGGGTGTYTRDDYGYNWAKL